MYAVRVVHVLCVLCVCVCSCECTCVWICMIVWAGVGVCREVTLNLFPYRHWPMRTMMTEIMTSHFYP